MAKASTKTKPEVVEEVPEEEDTRWKMPKPRVGQAIVFYWRGTVARRNTQIAWVSQVGESSIDVVYRNQGASEVYHKDDPRLVENPELRLDIGGVWEFTDEHNDIERRLAQLEEQVRELEIAAAS